MVYFVSRQRYWPHGDHVIEIACGGLDYANPDMLVRRYPELGEGREFDDPREALAAAMRIRDAWRGDGAACRIEAGWTGGNTIPFDEYPSDADLKRWADEEHASLL